MAIPALAPSITRPGRSVARQISRTELRAVPEIKSGVKADNKTFAIFLSVIGIIGLLLLLVINTMLAQDAFELRKLQSTAIALSDQREAVMRAIDFASSPEELAARAIKEGMIPSQSPRFLTLTPSTAIPVTLKK